MFFRTEQNNHKLDLNMAEYFFPKKGENMEQGKSNLGYKKQGKTLSKQKKPENLQKTPHAKCRYHLY